MATADQIKALILSHFSSDAERFKTLALNVAAHEAQHKHEGLATEILDQARRQNS